MTESAGALSSWGGFYVIVGSSGGALIGLQFVVITLIAGSRHRATGARSAPLTPTVVHLAATLLVSVIMSAPWASLTGPSLAVGLCGLGGLAYGVLIVHRARRQTEYEPVWEGWLWHSVLPCVSYATLAVAAVLLRSNPRPVLFVIGAATLGLLLIGIHNAWDTVTHIVVSESDGGTTKTD